MSVADVCRFAPSTTGPAHPGTLLAALLCWLDARSRGARVVLRLEDLDPQRCTAEHAARMIDDLAWLGVEFDAVERQSDHGDRHAAALDRLAAQGALYPCSAGRGDLQVIGRRSPDGGWAYDNRARDRPLPPGGWRACGEPLRARLPDGPIAPRDEGGLDLAQDAAQAMGDPVVRRRDGAIAYQLAVVVDDAAIGVTRVVRGRDIAPSTATQVGLQRLLGVPEPVYRHHALLLEERGRKLAKLHGSVGTPQLRPRYPAEALCGFLAHACGLAANDAPVTPRALVDGFAWERVAVDDRLVRWDGQRLALAQSR
ncbi:MAG TPA: glutamate--tRNA ligase family protein [Planctomycetota bacterium]|nr:glutamate--tRNA ligase family protein [Planctomycetota bacterium]